MSETVHGNVSSAAYEGWKRAALAAGAPMSAVMEALGLAFAETPLEQIDVAAVAVEARRIADARRNRRR